MESQFTNGPQCAKYLPAVMQESLPGPAANPIRSFLETFEEELQRTERIANDTHLLFDPGHFASVPDFTEAEAKEQQPVPKSNRWKTEFTNWLAACVSMQDWIECADRNSRIRNDAAPSDNATRSLIKDAAWLHRARGTPRGLTASIQAICNLDVQIVERIGPPGMSIGTSSVIGVDSWITSAPDPERQFTVVIRSNKPNEGHFQPAPLRTGAGFTRTLSKLHPAGRSEIYIWGPQRPAEQHHFTTASLKDASRLTQRLVNQSDAISSQLWRRFSATRRQILRDPTTTKALKLSSLVDELNEILRGPSLYDSRLFPAEKLSTQTLSLISKTPTREEVLQLNRLLLEDTYPEEIHKAGTPDETAPIPESDATKTAWIGRSEAVSQTLHSLIEREKPAHTTFYVAVAAPAPEIIAGGEPWLQIGVSEGVVTNELADEDLLDAAGLIRKLTRHADAVSQFLWNALGRSAQQSLANPETPLSQAQPLLLGELNRILHGPPLYEPGRFAQVPPSRETSAAFSQRPQGRELVRSNRLFLQDAYPREIAKAHRSPSSTIGRFSIK